VKAESSIDEFSAFAWFVPMQKHWIKLKAEFTSAEWERELYTLHKSSNVEGMQHAWHYLCDECGS
jgi:hypothetical protein